MLITPNVDQLDFVCRCGIKYFELHATLAIQEVLPGVFLQGLGYNGTFPGPTIKVFPGDTINIRVHNDLNEPTSLNITGMNNPNALDGIPDVEPSPLIQPGSFFDYRYKVPNFPGTHIYRPGFNGVFQQNKGMCGMLIVVGESSNTRRSLDYGFILQEFNCPDLRQFSIPPGTFSIDPFSDSPNLFCINGKCYPFVTPIRVVAGRNCRLRFANACSINPQPMHICGHCMKLTNLDGFPLNTPSINTSLIACGQTRETVFPCNNPGVWPILNEVPMRKCNNFSPTLGGMCTVIEYEPIEPIC